MKKERTDICYTPKLKHRLLQKTQRSASTPGIESKPALQLLTVGSYLQWLEAAAQTIGNNILKSFELHRTETPQLRAALKMRLQQKCEDSKGAG